MASRRDQIRMTASELRGFLEEQRIVQVATAGPRGWPHLVPLWYFVEDSGAADGRDLAASADSGDAEAAASAENAPALRGWTFAKSQKAVNLRRDPRATVSVDDGVAYDQLRGATFECDVELSDDVDEVASYGLALFERYAATGEGEGLPDDVRTMVLAQAAKRIALRFVPRRVASWDHGKLGGVY